MTTSPITSLSYSTKDPQLLAGGCYSGQICWWDVRAGSRPVGAVEFEHCHSEPVYSTIWTASKSGTELMTGGSDGFVRSIFNNLDDKQYDVLSHYWKYIFCENSDVRGFIWSSSALHNFLRCHVYRTILSLNHHEFRKW